MAASLIGRMLWVVPFLLGNMHSIVHWNNSIEAPQKIGIPPDLSPYLVGFTTACGLLGAVLIIINRIRAGAAFQMVFLILVTIYIHMGNYWEAYGTEDEWKVFMQILKNLSLFAALIMFVNYENRIIAQNEKYNKML